MLFHVRWALKNLLSNSKRTAQKTAFIVLALSIVMLCITLLDGSTWQMRESMYYSIGDLQADARGKKEKLGEVYKDMEKLFAGEGDLFREYRKTGKLLGSAGYASATLRGVEPGYIPYFSRTVGWNAPLEKKLERGSIILEAGLAAKADADKGETVSIRIQAEDGFVNANQFEVAGIYMGNPWLHKKKVLLHIDDVRELFINKDAVTTITGFFSGEKKAAELRSLVSPLSVEHSKSALFSTREDMENRTELMIFGYYRVFLIFIISTIILTFMIIMYFSIQNIYYVEYRNRRRELATLMTFGMKPGTLMGVVFFETLFMFLASGVLSFLIVFAVGEALSLFQITDLSYRQAVALLGGNSIVFHYVPLHLTILSVIVFLITVRSTLRGAGEYVKMHIREINSIG